MKRKIGFVGVGNMGKGVCHNLIKAGNEVSVFDKNKEAQELFKGEAYMAESALDAFNRSDVIFLSLPNSKVVEAVMEEFFNAGVSGKLIVDLSTSYPMSTRMLHKRMKENGGNLIDAPLLAGPYQAWEGTLPTSLAGDKDVIDEYDDMFASYSSSHEYVGESGNGHLVKLAQNWAGLLQAVLYAQLYPVMAKHGLEPHKMYEILNTEYFANWFFECYSQKFINRQFNPAFALELGLKDLTYMKKLCDEANVPGFMLDGAIDLCRVTLKEHKDQGKFSDMSSICETMYQYVGM